MNGPDMDQEELDRKLRAFFRHEAAGAQPPAAWWDAALSRLGEQEQPRRWWRLPAFFAHLAPLPVAAAGLALVMGLSAVAALVIGPGMGQDSVHQADSWDLVEAPGPVPSSGMAYGEESDGSGMAQLEDEAREDETRFFVTSASEFAQDPTAEDGPFLVIESAGSASPCPERPLGDALRDSEFALDGTVTQPVGADPSHTFFEVHRWYKGGDSRFVTVQVDESGPADMTAPGTRWLIAGHRGDDGVPRSEDCGLVQRHTEDAGREWERARTPEPHKFP
ncbi:MAG: anti-sigma factor [Dehalococcoidia bacterium]